MMQTYRKHRHKDYVKKATYNLFFRPKADIRQKLSELAEGDTTGLQTLLDDITIQDNYETFFTGKSIAFTFESG